MTGLRVAGWGKEKTATGPVALQFGKSTATERRGYRGNCGSGYLLRRKAVADDFEEAFNFFNRYYGASAAGKAMAAREGEGDKIFSFFNGRGFGGFDSFTAEFLAELVGDSGED